MDGILDGLGWIMLIYGIFLLGKELAKKSIKKLKRTNDNDMSDVIIELIISILSPTLIGCGLFLAGKYSSSPLIDYDYFHIGILLINVGIWLQIFLQFATRIFK